jgi:excinuclease ABC subunit A
METQDIVVRGARVHNLKNLHLTLPKNKLICFTGVSGSGKSSLAFDTLYAEGQRRYVTSLSAYARQFLGQMEKPDVDQITGLSPTISIAQKTAGQNPRSTVGTITEIYDYLRVLFARVGTPHCTECGEPIGAQTRAQIVSRIRALPVNSRLHILAPVVQERKGEYHELFADLQKAGYIRVRVDSQIFTLDQAPQLDRYSRHNIEVVVDRLILREREDRRLEEAIDNALRLGQGTFIVAREGASDFLLSDRFDCTACGISYQEPTPQIFSFNNPQGMCPDCHGLGTQVLMSERLMVPDPAKTLRAGALAPLGELGSNRWRLHLYEGAAEHLGFDLDTPWGELVAEQKHGFLYGLGDEKVTFTYTNLRGSSWSHDDKYEGVIPFLEEKFRGAKEKQRRELEQYMGVQHCERCDGGRLRPESLAVKIDGRNLPQLTAIPIEEARDFFRAVAFEDAKTLIAEEALKEIRGRLQLMCDMGLGYLTLDRGAHTLSGGEAQRIKLAKELCRRSTGRTLYILDEPTTGLHFADVDKLLHILHTFADQGNSVVVVEHNMEVIKTADYILDLGPEGGEDGGWIIAAGPPEAVAQNEQSHTGQALKKALKPQRAALPAAATNGHGEGNGWIREIEILGARQHNLRNIDVKIPRDQLTVISGVSGSGKSSLAFDTLYAEGQRRYVESLSAYARQFLEQMQKPKVERVSGLSPAIAIEQKAPSRNPRSTVGTVTEVYDYIRALYAALGTQYCPRCHVPAGTQTAQEMVERIAQMPAGRRILILAPIEPRQNEGYETLLARARSDGFLRARIDGTVHDLREEIQLERRHRHRIELVVDRLAVRASDRGRLTESVERALELGNGELVVASPDDETEERFSRRYSCPECGRAFSPLSPQCFSFNHQQGMCQVCEGLGLGQGVDRERVVVPHLSVREGAIRAWGPVQDPAFDRLLSVAGDALGFSLDTPYAALAPEARRALLYGAPEQQLTVENLSFRYAGVLPPLDEYASTSKRHRHLLGQVPCSACEGSRLKTDSRAVYLRDKSIVQVARLPISESLSFFRDMHLHQRERDIAGELLQEIRTRLGFLERVGLGYIDLERRAATLSGGEAQRIRLASQIGSGLTGVLYLLDEPTIGLHPRDNARLLDALNSLKDLGNTIVLVEHDRDTLEGADHIVDLGPGAGSEGGNLVAAGMPSQLGNGRQSLTSAYLRGELHIPVPVSRRKCRRGQLVVRGARQHNLKNIDVPIPLGRLVCVTGVSGSGKSSLVESVLFNALANELHKANRPVGEHDQIDGVEHIDKVIHIDQTPIGHSPRSTPATVMGVFDLMRQLYADLPDAKVAGFAAGRFSFNKPGGRCETCEGLGQRCIEMHFLPDVWVECDQCRGQRYMPEVLRVQFKGHSIADVLQMRVRDALVLCENIPRIRKRLQIMEDVGLGYMSLGQSSTTLSGGEAQRLKLAAELCRPDTGQTLYILDEPTTGLHLADIECLLAVLHRLVDAGNTMVVIEHNMDVIKTADHLIDLGPEGGDQGGMLVAAGAPEKVAQSRQSHTGHILADVLRRNKKARRT